MKGAGKPKSEWQPHVAALLQLKADLAAAQKAAGTDAPTSSPAPASSATPKVEPVDSNAQNIPALEEAIKQQVLHLIN